MTNATCCWGEQDLAGLRPRHDMNNLVQLIPEGALLLLNLSPFSVP